MKSRLRSLWARLRAAEALALCSRGFVLWMWAFLALPSGDGQIRFREVAAEAGLVFELRNAPTPEKRMIEAVPGGVAAFDADSDGLTDIYFANGAEIPSLRKSGERYWNRLFLNLGGMRFVDATREAGVAGRGYSMGVAAGDYDNDGDTDLFVAGVRANSLYRNDGNGVFVDVAEVAGIASEAWSVAAGWFDYNKDGALDLFVVNYLDWDLTKERFCSDRERGLRIYCSPTYFDGLPNALYRNRGDGTFEDVSQASGIGRHAGKGMSVAFADYDLDGWPDVFVTNDTEADFLFRNLGDGTFEEAGLLAGVGLASDGNPISSMGVSFRDYDNDGLPDIHVTALPRQTFPLFRNLGGGLFDDVTARSGVHSATVALGGWSNAFMDFDNDGFKDIFVAASHVNDLAEDFENVAYEQPNVVLRNSGGGTFANVSERAADFRPAAHRGAAFADFDQDGRVDVVVSVLGGSAELWRNVGQASNHWLGVRLRGTRSNRDGMGAVIHADSQRALATSAVGYASSSHVPVHLGLGRSTELNEIRIAWPSGTEQAFAVQGVDRFVTVREPESRDLD